MPHVLLRFMAIRSTRELKRSRRIATVWVVISLGAAVLIGIVGLEVGADDYLAKPFNPRELVARIQAVLRRRPPPAPPGAPSTETEIVEFGDFRLNLATRTLTRNDEPVPLTTGEFALLKVLAQHPRTPLSRDKLMELGRGREFGAFDRSIDVQVSRLRKLIEADPAKPAYIQTVWGFGYVFIPDGDGTKAVHRNA
ncbi:MAG: winged helix-turn-helix domain-containing protein [Rhodospirillaceae bacterium]